MKTFFKILGLIIVIVGVVKLALSFVAETDDDEESINTNREYITLS